MLAGFLIVDMPGDNDKNLAFDLGWPREMAEASAHIDIAGVDPAFRGLGLQRELTRRAEELLAAKGIKAFLSTVHPDNAPSLNNILAMGYSIGATKSKYGGVLRHVLYKKVNTPQ